MTRTLKLTTEIPDSRQLMIRLPEDVPTGTARIILQLTPEAEYLEDFRDIEDARRALAEAEREGTIGLAELKADLGL